MVHFPTLLPIRLQLPKINDEQFIISKLFLLEIQEAYIVSHEAFLRRWKTNRSDFLAKLDPLFQLQQRYIVVLGACVVPFMFDNSFNDAGGGFRLGRAGTVVFKQYYGELSGRCPVDAVSSRHDVLVGDQRPSAYELPIVL